MVPHDSKSDLPLIAKTYEVQTVCSAILEGQFMGKINKYKLDIFENWYNKSESPDPNSNGITLSA